MQRTERPTTLCADITWRGAGTHGYHAGCAFAEGNAQSAQTAPTSRNLLCSPALLDLCDVDDCVQDILERARDIRASDGGEAELFAGLRVVWSQCLADLPQQCFVCLNDYSAGGICRREIEDPRLQEVTFDGNFDFPNEVPPTPSITLTCAPPSLFRLQIRLSVFFWSVCGCHPSFVPVIHVAACLPSYSVLDVGSGALTLWLTPGAIE